MERKAILLVGGGGHCRSVLDCLLNSNFCGDIGIVEKVCGGSCMGVPVVGCDADLSDLFADGWHYAAITLGSIGNTARRRTLYRLLKEIGFTLPPIVDPSAILGREVVVGEGVFIGKRTIINTGALIGTCVIINTGAILEHDCVVEDFAHISPGSTLCGEVRVGINTHIGAGASVRQQIRIGRDSLIGVGSVVIQDVPDHCTIVGNPGRILVR